MNVRSPYRAVITDVLRGRGSERPLRLELPADFAVEFSRIAPGSTIDADLTIARVSGGVMVRGMVAGLVRHTCTRCLTEWDEPLALEVAELFSASPTEDDDAYPIDGDEIDLEPMLRDAVLLSFPLVPSCGEDCPGLGQQAGTDLNAETGSDSSPFAVLKELLPDAPDE